MNAGKKRGNNEGTVYREGARSGNSTGRWIAQVSVNGTKRRAIASTEAKAKQRLRQMQSQIEHGTTITDGSIQRNHHGRRSRRRLTPNMLRHSAASLMSDAGIPLERIADQLGHEDTRMLANHYRHQIRPTIDAALILDDVLNPRET